MVMSTAVAMNYYPVFCNVEDCPFGEAEEAAKS